VRLFALVVASLAACGRLDFDAVGIATTSWWDDAWVARKTITIDHARVRADLADFPVLIELHDPELAARARPDGADLAFIAADGTPLAFELESYTASPPALVAWVRVPQLSATTDTTIALYYGNPSATSQAQPAAVWSNAFVGVYHFGTTSLDVHDSTGTNDATNQGAQVAVGKIGGAAMFDGTANLLSPAVGIDLGAGARNTVTFWVDYAGAFGKGPFAFTRAATAYDVWFEGTGCAGFNTQGGEVLGTTVLGLADRWVYVAAVFYNGLPDPAFNAIYIDGAAQILAECATGTPVSRTVGDTANWGGNPGYQITGAVDEGRIANVVRSAEWIGTEFANQSDPASFATIGGETLR